MRFRWTPPPWRSPSRSASSSSSPVPFSDNAEPQSHLRTHVSAALKRFSRATLFRLRVSTKKCDRRYGAAKRALAVLVQDAVQSSPSLCFVGESTRGRERDRGIQPEPPS